MYALMLEKVTDSFVSKKDCFRAVIFDIDADGCACVASIIEYDGTVTETAQVAIETFGYPITGVWFDGHYIQPDCLSVTEAAEAVLYTRLLEKQIYDKECLYLDWDMSAELIGGSRS